MRRTVVARYTVKVLTDGARTHYHLLIFELSSIVVSRLALERDESKLFMRDHEVSDVPLESCGSILR